MVEYLSVGVRLHAMYGRALYASEVMCISTSAKRKKKPATWIKSKELNIMSVEIFQQDVDIR